jgi:hypothetical protein
LSRAITRTDRSRPTGSWAPDVRAALPGWLAARAVVLLALAVARVVDAMHTGPRTPWEGFARRGLLGWDADWYQRIAVHGYGALPEEALRFFPLHPLVARILGGGTWLGAGVALLVVANACALACGALLHRLCLVLGTDEVTARRAATTFALAPPAFVLVMGYSEGLALALALVYLLALYQRSPAVAIVAGVLAGAARPTGILLALPAVLWWLAEERRRRLDSGDRVRLALVAAAPVTGAAAYLGWCQMAAGGWSKPFAVQTVSWLRGDVVDPITTLAGAARDVVTLHADLHQVVLLLTAGLLIIGARRWPAELTAWGAAALLLACSAERLGSMERYAWAAVIPVMTLATLGSRPSHRIVTVGLGAGLMVLATLTFTGHYVP